jgi:nicotinate-nucleotide adenylyltransferase
MHIALFGTSADPPTLGHQTVLQWLSQRFDLVAVWASDNPFKPQQTHLYHRISMLKILIQDSVTPRKNIRFCPQLGNPRALYSIQMARQLWPDAEFTLVIGSDLVAQLPQWYQVHQWITAVNLLIVPRPDAPLVPAALAELRRMGAQMTIAALTGPDTSSTAYRSRGDAQLVSPAIQAYIHQAQLYSCQNAIQEKQLLR